MDDSPAKQNPPTENAPRPVLISLSIDPGEPISGTLTADGQATRTAFCGWMELIAAITAQREDHSA